MKKIPIRRSIKTKMIGIVFVSSLFITLVLGYMSFEFSRNRLVSMLGDSIRGIAAVMAALMHPDDIAAISASAKDIQERYRISTSNAFFSAYDQNTVVSQNPRNQLLIDDICRMYVRYTKLLQSIKTMNKIDSPINIYVREGNRLKLVLTSDQILLTGSLYSIRPEAEEAFSAELPQSTGIYNDKDGTWISAYAAIPDRDPRNKKSIIEINYKVDSHMVRLRKELRIIILACLAGFCAAFFLSYKLITGLVTAIKALDKAVEELEGERYDTLINVKSDDEVGHLSAAFEVLRLSIKEKIEELRLSLVREKRAHLESIVALTNAIEMRDPNTRQHLQRVEKYALLIAKEMHLSRENLQKLKYSCFLHDIGKIYIETSLLQKVKLSEEDYAEIKKHSERGAKIIEGIQFLTDVKDAVLYHQERYDGKGYPKGLKGHEIPLIARIVSVADAFDAITTDRPYKKKISFKEAMDEIERSSGTQFDPEVCRAFLRYRDKIGEIAKRHFERLAENPIEFPPDQNNLDKQV